jgi:hypothetical protein
MQATARVTSPHISRDTGCDDFTRREGCRRLLLEGPPAKEVEEEMAMLAEGV